MSFYPPIPISFTYSGDKNIAVRLNNEGRRRAGKLYNFLSKGYGNPFDEQEDRLFSGRDGPFLYLTNDGYLVTVNVRINGNLTYADIDAAPYVDPEQGKPPCECCRDCITIGEYQYKIVTFDSAYRDRYVIDICLQLTADEYGKTRLIEGIYTTDGNSTFSKGEKYLVVSSPALNMIMDTEKNIPASVEMSNNLRTWNGELYSRQAKIWQVYDCMGLSDIKKEGVDLREVGIDNTLYTVQESICEAKKVIDIEDPEVVENPETASLKYFLTSIKAGDCFSFLS